MPAAVLVTPTAVAAGAAAAAGELFTARSAAFCLLSPNDFSLTPPIGAAGASTTVRVNTPQLEDLGHQMRQQLEPFIGGNNNSSNGGGSCCLLLVHPDGSRETIPVCLRNGYLEATIPPVLLEVRPCCCRRY